MMLFAAHDSAAKGYIFFCILVVMIKARLMRCQSESKIAELLLKQEEGMSIYSERVMWSSSGIVQIERIMHEMLLTCF